MTQDESMAVAMAARILGETAAIQDVLRAEDDSWKGELWAVLEEAGLTLSWVPPEFAGSGVTMDEGFAILREAGRVALAVPLAETMLAGWLLAQAGLASPGGAMSVAPGFPGERLTLSPDGTLRGIATRVAFARESEHLAVLAESADGPAVCLVKTADCEIGPHENLAREPSDTVRLAGCRPVATGTPPEGFSGSSLMLMGAAVRAQQIAGAMEAALDLSVRYAGERVAFGRAIGKFQAVQQTLAEMAGEVAASVAAASSAGDAVARGLLQDDAGFLEISAARVRTGEGAETASAIAHQVHGAIGYTDEHALHRLTLRALAWRDDFGDEVFWATRLGEFVAERGAHRLWPALTSL